MKQHEDMSTFMASASTDPVHSKFWWRGTNSNLGSHTYLGIFPIFGEDAIIKVLLSASDATGALQGTSTYIEAALQSSVTNKSGDIMESNHILLVSTLICSTFLTAMAQEQFCRVKGVERSLPKCSGRYSNTPIFRPHDDPLRNVSGVNLPNVSAK